MSYVNTVLYFNRKQKIRFDLVIINYILYSTKDYIIIFTAHLNSHIVLFQIKFRCWIKLVMLRKNVEFFKVLFSFCVIAVRSCLLLTQTFTALVRCL